MIDLTKLVEWLGPEGARSGLRDGDVTLKDLIDLAKGLGLPLLPKPTRDDVANELAYAEIAKVDKSIDELMEMSSDELLAYLQKSKPTVRELLSILDRLGVKPGSEGRKHLLKFTAREISDTGMYQRVARGNAPDLLRKSG